MGAAHPFSSQRDFPVSVCAKFQEGLDSCLQTGFWQYFPAHSVVQLLNATHQQKTLQSMLQAAQQAEDNLHAVQCIAREAVGMSQAFHAGATRGIPIVAGAFPSQAKKTLTHYSGDSKSLAASNTLCGGGLRPWSCFGCGGPHPYLEFRGNEGHVIICPNKDNPGMRLATSSGCARTGRSAMPTIQGGRILGPQTYPTLMSRARSASPIRCWRQ